MQADRLLVFNDEPRTSDLISYVAEHLGFAVSVQEQTSDIRQGLASFKPDVIFLDLPTLDRRSNEVIRHLAHEGTDAQILLASDCGRGALRAVKRLAEEQGLRIANVLYNPVQADELEVALRQIRLSKARMDEAALAHAIASGELTVHYQPKVAVAGRAAWRISSLEALVRWEHPELGLVTPDIFIPLAEKSGLIVGLTDYVVGSVLEQLKTWCRQGVEVPVAINLSARIIEDLDLPDRLSHALAVHRIEPRLIILEITESRAMADMLRAMDVLARLRLKGIRLSIDDFGTGHSSLIHLHRMPFTELKIDRQFVFGLPEDPVSANIVKGIVNLAHTLDLKVCVEGVETAEAFSLLRDYGCDLFQGYHFSPALPSAEITRLLEDRLGHPVFRSARSASPVLGTPALRQGALA